MLKKLLLLLMILVPVSSVAQSTTVTATITDSDSFVWKGGTYSFTFVPCPNGPSSITQYTWTGGMLTNPITGSLNSSGAMSVSVPTSSTITPVCSQWAIQICPQAISGCFTYTTAISGTSLNLTSTLSALANGPRFPLTFPTTFGYGTVEIISAINPGAIFWDVTAGACKQYNGTTWGSCGGGGSGTGFAFATTQTLSDSTHSTISFPTISGTGHTLQLNCGGNVDDGGGFAQIGIRLNNDSGTHYQVVLWTAANPGAVAGAYQPSLTSFNDTFFVAPYNNLIMTIPDYTDTTISEKLVHVTTDFTPASVAGTGTNGKSDFTGSYFPTSAGAITQIDLIDLGGGHFTSGTSCTLYGLP